MVFITVGTSSTQFLDICYFSRCYFYEISQGCESTLLEIPTISTEGFGVSAWMTLLLSAMGVGLCKWSCLHRWLQGLALPGPTGPTCPEGRTSGGAWLREPRCRWRDPSWREELPPWPCAPRLGWHDLAPSSFWNLCAEESWEWVSGPAVPPWATTPSPQ